MYFPRVCNSITLKENLCGNPILVCKIHHLATSENKRFPEIFRRYRTMEHWVQMGEEKMC